MFAEMVAACDPNVRFWINAKLLKNLSQWQAGWQSLQEIEEIENDVSWKEPAFVAEYRLTAVPNAAMS